MRKSIVFKWFALIFILFFVMFLIVGVTQNYFFGRFYIDRKADSMRAYMDDFYSIADENRTEMAYEMYRNNHMWITVLDQYGRICDVENYYIEVELKDESKRRLLIPLYPFEGNFSDISSLFKIGDDVILDSVNIDDEIIPYQIQTQRAGAINFAIANKLHGPDADESYFHLTTAIYRGIVTYISLQEQPKDIPFPYGEFFFLESVKEFQVQLLAGKENFKEMEFNATENLVDYKIIVKPIADNNLKGYVFAMASLQPVDEAISIMQQFYPYFLGCAFLCVIFLAFIVFVRLSKPLLTINRITGKIAKMDFTEKLPMYPSDEIGQLSRNINHLSEQIESHIRSLEQDLDKERKLEKTRKDFISGVSHELKTPLSVIKSCLSILQDGIAIEKTQHYFQAMEKEIQLMDMLIVNMLDLAKFESGTYKPKIAPFEIDCVVNEVCESLSSQIKEKNINLTLTLLSLTVIGHKALISRVISNFLSNAIRHTDIGNSILIMIIQKGREAEISVENQGLPISNEDKEKIWQQFYRAETQLSKTGTGLGLSLSKSILRLHNATYGVENTVNGVRFFFLLPLH